MTIVAAAAAASLVIAATNVGASEAPRTQASWQVVEQVLANSGPNPDFFTAVTAQTPTSAWAFESTASKTAPIVAWRLRGSTWSRVEFPETYGSSVVAATGATPSGVYVATSKGALLTWSHSTWALVAKFVGIDAVDAPRAGDLWVNGRRTSSRATGGLWQLENGVWRHRSADSYGAIDAVSDTAIFSVTRAAVEEFNGSRWQATSLAALLPAKQPLCQSPQLDSVEAFTPTDVWVTAQGGCQDFTGPFRLLHFVRSRWSIAADREEGEGTAYPGGEGSLWIPTREFGGSARMLRLAAGRLTLVSLPLGRQELAITGIATPQGSTDSIAIGWTIKCQAFSCDGQAMRGVILRYGA
jgi:hypothetical protein